MKLSPREIEQIKLENAAYTEAWERGFKEGFECGYAEGAAKSQELTDYYDPESGYWEHDDAL